MERSQAGAESNGITQRPDGQGHDYAEIRRCISLMIPPGDIFEVRALAASTPDNRRSHVESGYFSDSGVLTGALRRIQSAAGIYLSLNQIDPALHARAHNRFKPAEKTTGAENILRRRWLLIDFDPVRPTGISSTDDEHEASRFLASEVRGFLHEQGWPSPIFADSGNGSHLYYRIDLPTQDDGICKRVLTGLDHQFSDECVKVDTATHQPAQLGKLFGTWARKGDSLPDRPHRRAHLIGVPSAIEVVSEARLRALADSNSPARNGCDSGPVRDSGTETPAQVFLARHRIPIHRMTRTQDGNKIELEKCPFCDGVRKAAVFENADGRLGFKCFRTSCAGRAWRDLRAHFEPDFAKAIATEDVSLPVRNEPSTILQPWPTPIDPDAYYGLAGDVVEAIEPHTEADPVALLFQFLVAFGNVIHRSAHFLAEADRHAMNLFLVLVGRSAKGRKGTSWGHIKRLFALVALPWVESQIQSGMSSGEGLIWAIRDPITKPKKNQSGDGETEFEIVDEGKPDKRLLVVETEFASTLRVVERESNTLSPIVRRAWDSDNLQSLVKNSPAKATKAHISIIGHITRDEVLRYLTTTETGNGFANRFLWVCTKRARTLPEGGNFRIEDHGILVDRLRLAMSFASKAGEIVRSENCRTLWREIYTVLSEGKPGLRGVMTARAEAQTMRLASIYALLDRSTTIEVHHLRAALALWRYAEDSVAYVFGDSVGDPIADRVLRALRANSQGLTKTDIRDLFGRNKEGAQVDRALASLLEHGLARPHAKATGGRSAEVWVAEKPANT